MKGWRGGDFERQLSGEADVQRVVFITLVIITVLPGTAKSYRSLPYLGTHSVY